MKDKNGVRVALNDVIYFETHYYLIHTKIMRSNIATWYGSPVNGPAMSIELVGDFVIMGGW